MNGLALHEILSKIRRDTLIESKASLEALCVEFFAN